MSALTNSSCNFFSSQSSLLTFQRNLVLKGTFYKSSIDFGSRTYDSNVKNEMKFPSLRGGFGRSRRFVTSASLVGSSQIASNIFTLGTTIVIPFYTLMVIAPKSELTKRSVNSKIPYIILGALYVYLLYCSWTPETLRLMFAGKYWLPELPGITRMFSNEVTVASAWLHLLAVDLFAARQVFQDGLKDGIETRHSIVLCLLFCPVGIMSHMLTKALENLHRRFKKDGNIRAASLSIFQH